MFKINTMIKFIKKCISKAKPKKFEVAVIYGNLRMIERDLEKAQNNGWEIAGNIDVTEQTARIAVPIKRLIK